jgi:hypothetical protein
VNRVGAHTLSGDRIMPRPLACLTALTLGVLGASSLAAQDATALCQSLAKMTVGQWASYAITGTQGSGTLRLAAVGLERRGDSTLYWLEISGSGSGGKSGIMQFLVPGFGGDAATVHSMIVKTEGQPAMKLPDQMVSMMRGRMGQNNAALDAVRRCASAQVVGWENVTAAGGSIRALHLKNVDGAEAWIAGDVPFGIVKARPKDGGEMILTGRGMDAKSSITEKPQEMPGMMMQKP